MATPHLTPTAARAIAKEAYIYGFPVVDLYRIMHAFFEDAQNPDYKGPWNQLHNFARVFTSDDKTGQTPNSDTLYSFLGLDLRTEPMVLTVPEIDPKRYYCVQFFDAYSFTTGLIGSRTTGNGAGIFLVAGPGWEGETPPGVKQVIRSETELVLGAYRTQLFSPEDIDNAKQVQVGYQVQTLSAFLGQPAPKAAPPIDFIQPLTAEVQKSSLEFFNILNFLLGFCPTHPSERDLMERFAKIGVGAGQTFNAGQLSPEIKAAINAGVADAWADYESLKQRVDAKELTSDDMFGTREFLQNNYLYRMTGAVIAICANPKEEAMYPIYNVDADGQLFDGNNRYRVRFAPGLLPPVNAFWSLTMYELPSRLLSANPLNRYLLNSPMLPQFKRDADGGLTLFIQNESPGQDLESNWLPAPKGPFFMVMRLYWPKAEALDGTWIEPPIERMP